MSFTLGVQPWFQRATVGADLTHHARDFGIAFVEDECVGNNNNSKAVPDLIPIGKRRRSSDACGRVSGSVVMIDGDSHEESKLLRLFGGGDSDSGVSVNSVTAERKDEGQSQCSVLLDPLPSDLLRSLTTEGQISAERAAKTCQQPHEWEDSLPMISDNEVQGLLQNLVEEGEDSEPTLACCQRQESLLQPPSLLLRDDAIDDVRDEASASRDCATVAPPRRNSGGKKRRKRSTSCSTTSSACSATSPHPQHEHRHRHKRRHRHRTPSPPPRARVNPIFVWVKQDDTRIVEVLCEDYDKRNRIRLTKTAQGWRAIPRTERLSSLTASDQSAASGTDSCHQNAPLTDELPASPTERANSHNNIVTSLVPEDDELHDDDDDDDALSQQTKDEFVDETLLELERSGIDNIIDNVLSPAHQDCDHDEGSESKHGDGVELNGKEGTNLMETNEAADCDCSGAIDNNTTNCECADDPCADEPRVQSSVQRLDMNVDEKVPSDVARVEAQQVVQKDNVVLAESVDSRTELEPTDLSLPKSAGENRQPPKAVLFARSILRTTPTSPSPISRASPRLGISPALPEPAATADILPAHQTAKQQQKSMFLESLLSSPRKCHPVTAKPSLVAEHAGPLNLGKSSVRSSGSPTITCSEEVSKKEFEEPKPKCLKLEDITLKSLLSRQTESKNVIKEENKFDVRKSHDAHRTSESTKARKSRLLELLTSEPSHSTVLTDLDPLTQLKKILSDPDLAIPDPLLVPRDRLHELVSSPAKEIPRLLTLRPELRLPEALAYPSLLQDPNLLVVSIAYLQNLLRNPDKPAKEGDSYSSLGAFLEWQRFQGQQMQAVEVLEAQLKQQTAFTGRDLDPGSAQALNQMMWLPYLNQLEATAMACGNNQEFLNVLNAVFPTSYGVPYAPGMAPPPGFQLSSDYKTQLELQQTFSMWQEVMAQAAATSQPFNPLKNGLNNKTPPSVPNKMVPNRPVNVVKKSYSSARTSPITPNFHPHPRTAPTSHHHYSPLMAGGHTTHHPYNQHQPRPRPPSVQPKTEVPSTRPAVTCKSLRNLLSSPRREESPSEILAPFKATHEQPPKLKVKQHLVDPSIKPKLLKHEIKPEVTPTGEERVSPPQLHPHLWHPLFGSQKSSYNSPWQWTTVTVNGE